MSEVLEANDAVAGPDLFYEVVQWMNREAELLDDRRDREWLEEMISQEIVYQVPIRITVERARGLGFVEGKYHLNETYGSLQARIARNETGYAWAEDPPSRSRHFVTNIRVLESDDGSIKTRSNLLLVRTRHDQTAPQVLSAERHDVLNYEGRVLKLRQRVVLLDHTAIGTHNFALIF